MSKRWKDAVSRLRKDMEKAARDEGDCTRISDLFYAKPPVSCPETDAAPRRECPMTDITRKHCGLLTESMTLSEDQRNTISRAFPHLSRIDPLVRRSSLFLDITVETLGRVSAVLRMYRQGAMVGGGDYDPSEGPSHNEIEAMHLLRGCGFAPALLEEGELLVPIRINEQLYRFWYIRHQVRGRRFCDLVRDERERALEQLRKFAVMCSMVNLEVGGVDAKSVLWDGEKIVWTDFSGFQSTARPAFAVEEDNKGRIEELISKLHGQIHGSTPAGGGN